MRTERIILSVRIFFAYWLHRQQVRILLIHRILQQNKIYFPLHRQNEMERQDVHSLEVPA